MVKNVAVFVLLAAAIAAIVYTVVKQTEKTRGKIVVKEAYAEGQVSQAIQCDACGEITTGHIIKRPNAQRYQKCPQCGQLKGRPIVYYMCQNPDCNRALVKVRNVVVENGRVLPGDPTVCPVCRREEDVIGMELDLTSAERIAKETGQEFP